jgi:MFS family permease
LVYAILVWISDKGVPLIIQDPFNVTIYLKNKDNYSKLALSFFWGFFFVNTYYNSMIITQNIGFHSELIEFIPIIIIAFIISVVFAGVIADTMGRRFPFLLGCCIQSLAFLLTTYFYENKLVMNYIFPATLGLGFGLIILSGYLLFMELSNPKQVRDEAFAFFIFIGFGTISGILVGDAFRPLITNNNGSMTVILLFIFIIAMLSISQLKETLPSKQELEWKSSIQYLYVLAHSGLLLYEQDLRKLPDTGGKLKDGNLLAGALIAISMLLKETAENKNPLKVVRQEGFSILIEESNHVLVAIVAVDDLKAIRNKMQAFLIEFEEFFGELMEKGAGCDTNMFLPTKALVNRIFK